MRCMARDPLSLWYVLAQGRLQILVVLPLSHDKLTDPSGLWDLDQER